MLGDCVGLVSVLLIGSVGGTCMVFGRTVVEVESVDWPGSIVAGVIEGVSEIEGCIGIRGLMDYTMMVNDVDNDEFKNSKPLSLMTI
ncbi:hypothetical protein Tco_1345029 [Tanacetum coccineum]